MTSSRSTFVPADLQQLAAALVEREARPDLQPARDSAVRAFRRRCRPDAVAVDDAPPVNARD